MSPGQELHDRLKAELPEGSACVDDCPYCATDPKAPLEGGGKVSDKVYDQETLDTLLADARAKAAEEARSEADKELAEVQSKLTEKDAALEKAEAKIEELEGEIAERDRKVKLDEVAEERAAKVAEVTDFSEDQIEERKSGWAELSEEAFTTLLEDFKAVTESAKATGDKDGEKKPPKSKFSGERETAGKQGTDTSRLREFFAASGS